MTTPTVYSLAAQRASNRHLIMEIESRGRRIRELELQVETLRKQLELAYVETVRLRLLLEGEP